MIYTHIIAAVIAALVTWFIQDNRHAAEINKVKLDATVAVNAAKNEVSYLKQQHADAIIVAKDAMREEQLAITNTYQGALNAARIREKNLQADLLAARAESDGMRTQLSEAARRIAGAPPESVAEYATTVGELLAGCSRERAHFAEKADGHASDVRTLRDAWPVIQKVIPPRSD